MTPLAQPDMRTVPAMIAAFNLIIPVRPELVFFQPDTRPEEPVTANLFHK
jgi:hypothetical protein